MERRPGKVEVLLLTENTAVGESRVDAIDREIFATEEDLLLGWLEHEGVLYDASYYAVTIGDNIMLLNFSAVSSRDLPGTLLKVKVDGIAKFISSEDAFGPRRQN